MVSDPRPTTQGSTAPRGASRTSSAETTTIEEALEQFLLQLDANGRAEHTRLQYRRHVLCLARWMAASGEGARLAALTSQVVARFMVSGAARNRPDGRPKKATAVNALRSSIRCFCGYLHDAGLVPANPAALLRRAICSPPTPRALSEDEVERLLAVLAEGTDAKAWRDRVLFTLMLRTGIRIGSALGLDVEDVDLERGELILRRAKGNRVERVFMPESFIPLLVEYLATVRSGALFRNGAGERMSARHAARRLAGYFAKTGLRRVAGTHVLRHTFAVRLYQLTRDVFLVREALLHRSIMSTMAYAQRDEGRLRRALLGRSTPLDPTRNGHCLWGDGPGV